MVLEALRQVPKATLLQAPPESPLPEPHHLYLTFRTDHHEVAMPPYLRDSYPEEMTIVFKHQYRNLEVEDEGFSVTLFFNGVPESMYVPFAALTAFVDAGVEFGLRFDGVPEDGPAEAEPGAPSATAAPSASDEDDPDRGDPDRGDPDREVEDRDDSRANVVSIDRFRRNSS